MTKVDVFSGFLGAGKTTLIKKLISEAYNGQSLVLIENEFGEIGIDGGFMQDAGINVTEMNSGCICCSLTGDFRAALKKVVETYAPDRILIEPSGVGKLSDIITAVEQVQDCDLVINGLGTVVDASKCKMYAKNFGEFFNNQVENAGCIILSRTSGLNAEKLAECVALLKEKNPNAVIITTPWEELSGEQILSALEQKDTLEAALEHIEQEHEEHEEHCCHHHQHGHDEDEEEEEHEHHHHHHHEHDEDEEEEEEEHEHHHHHHHHDEECDDPECSCHHHHHHEDEEGEEHEHHHHHHHHHDADEVFTSWGTESARKFSEAELKEILEKLGDENAYGIILRAKGIVDATDGEWIHFDYTPGEINIRRGSAGVTGRLCVIGSKINEEAIQALFA